MQTLCTPRDHTKYAVISLALVGAVCIALAKIGSAHEDAQARETFAPIRVDHIARGLRYAPASQFERAESLAVASVASAPAAEVMRAAGEVSEDR